MEVLNKEKVLENAKRLIDEGKIDKAIIEYRKLLDIDPKDMRIKIRIAELLIRQKKVAEAIKVYKEVADSYTEDGFYLKAVTVYKNILRLNPSLIDINWELAELYEKMGLNRDAIHQYQILANSLEQKGEYEALIRVRKKVADLDPHNIAARIRLAEACQFQGMEDEALNEYEKLIDVVKTSGSPEQLMELYEKILSYRPDNIDLLRALSKLYYKRGEWKMVVSRLEKKDKLLEGQTDLILMLADVYGRLNQIETASGKYKEAAEVFIENGELDKALDAYKEILVIAPDHEDEVRELVGEVDPDLFEKIKGEAEEKRQELEERAAAEEAEAAARAAAEEAEEAKAKEAPPEHVPPAERVPEISEKDAGRKRRDAEAAFELGKAYRQMGLENEARPELTKSLELYRELAEAGYGDEEIGEKVAMIDAWLRGEEYTPAPPPAKVEEKKPEAKPKEEPKVEEKVPGVPKPEAKPEVPKAKPEKKAEEVKKEEKKEAKKVSKEKEKKKGKEKEEAPKKKRDKRMGFV